MNTQRGSSGTGKRPLVARVDHAYPVVPQAHTYSALMSYIRYHFGIVLPSFAIDEREARLARIAAVYPEAAAEARRAHYGHHHPKRTLDDGSLIAVCEKQEVSA
jgi:hypothetical protein